MSHTYIHSGHHHPFIMDKNLVYNSCFRFLHPLCFYIHKFNYRNKIVCVKENKASDVILIDFETFLYPSHIKLSSKPPKPDDKSREKSRIITKWITESAVINVIHFAR